MVTVIRLARVLVLLALAALTSWLVVGLVVLDTSAVEKTVLVVLTVAVIALAAKVSTVTLAAERRLRH